MTVQWYGQAYMAKLKRGMKRNMTSACVLLERDIKKSFPKASGTLRERRKTPSAPGEIPHVVTATLMRAIHHTVSSTGLTGLPVGRVGVMKATSKRGQDAKALEYAAYLEFGTSRMEKRPYLRPALDRNKTKLRLTLAKYIRT